MVCEMVWRGRVEEAGVDRGSSRGEQGRQKLDVRDRRSRRQMQAARKRGEGRPAREEPQRNKTIRGQTPAGQNSTRTKLDPTKPDPENSTRTKLDPDKTRPGQNSPPTNRSPLKPYPNKTRPKQTQPEKHNSDKTRLLKKTYRAYCEQRKH